MCYTYNRKVIYSMIYLLRHGEIEDPGSRRFIGQTDCRLSTSGRAQAEYWKTWLQGKGVVHIYCSDLVRSSETAEIISSGLGVKISVNPDLKEIHLGEWDGEPMQRIRKKFPASWTERGARIDAYRTPAGESFNDLYNRVVPAFASIARKMAAAHVLIVGHAGVNRMILCHVLGMPIRRLFSIRQDYGGLNIIENDSTGFQVASMNITLSSSIKI